MNNSSAIGIRAFEMEVVNGVETVSLLTNDASGSASNYISWPGNPLLIEERPSVAISPDHGIWVAFYTLGYGADEACSGGLAPPQLNVFFAKGSSSLTNNQCKFTFGEAPQKIYSGNASQDVMGLYDMYRGFCYEGTNTSQFFVDLASGPSIQVVSDDFSECNSPYHVGIVYAYTYRVAGTVDDPGDVSGTGLKYNSWLSFYSMKAFADDNATSLVQNRASWDRNDNPIEVDDDGVTKLDNGNSPLRFFPVLKYTYYSDPSRTNEAMNDSIQTSASFAYAGKQYSHFLLAYMRTDWSRNGTNNKHLSSADCQVALSFDNKGFTLFEPGIGASGSTLNYLRPAEPVQGSGNIEPKDDYWGNKVDIAGDPFTVTFEAENGLHPIWKSIRPGNTGAQTIITNTANWIQVKAYINGYPGNFASAFPTGGIFRTDSETPNVYIWGDYAYFEFNGNNRPSSIQVKTSNVISGFGTLYNSDVFYNPGPNQPPKTPDGYCFIPGVASTNSNFPFGFRLAPYTEQTYTQGNLGFSDQRKIVSTGSIAHMVYERNGKVWYALNCYGAGTQGWTPGFALQEDNTPQGVTASNPSIAVYQEGDGSAFNGQAAICAVWTEKSTVTNMVSIKLRTREINACTGEWNLWSGVYEINSHALPANPPIDNTTAVVAPLLTPVNAPSGDLYPTNLLGWTVTWTSPRLTIKANPMPGCTDITQQTGLYSRTWLRTDPFSGSITTNNHHWGSNAPAGLTAYLTGAALQPPNTANQNFNILVEPNPCAFAVPPGISTPPYNPLAFPSVVSTENKNPSYRSDNDVNYSQEVAVSTIGNGPGIWVFNAKYDRSSTPGAFIGLTGNGGVNLGENALWVSTPGTPPGVSFSPDNNLERNPCVTINGQAVKFVAWERLDRITQPGSIFSFQSAIPVRRSEYGAPWNTAIFGWSNVPLLTTYTEDAADMQWKWLRNPSITAFPKSRLHNDDSHPNLDIDPGSAELCFWQQNTCISNVTPPLAMLVDEEFSFRYSEPPGAVTEPGGHWKPDVYNPPFNPFAFSSPSHVSNTQLSFGTYNAGNGAFDNNGMNFSSEYGSFNDYNSTDISGTPTTDVVSMWSSVAYKMNASSRKYHTYLEDVTDEGATDVRFIIGDVLNLDRYSSNRKEILLTPSNNSDKGELFSSDPIVLEKEGGRLTFTIGLLYSGYSEETNNTVLKVAHEELPTYLIQVVYGDGRVETLREVAAGDIRLSDNRFTTIEVRNGDCVNHSIRISIRKKVISSQALVSSHLTSETHLDGYSPLGIETICLKEDPGGNSTLGNLHVTAPFPNPLLGRNDPISISIASSSGNQAVSIEMFDALGRNMANMEYLIDEEWKNIQIPNPKISGTYYIQIRANGVTKLFSIVVQ